MRCIELLTSGYECWWMGGEILNLMHCDDCRQAEVAALLVELKPSALVVDCLPNMDAATVTQRAVYVSRHTPEMNSIVSAMI